MRNLVLFTLLVSLLLSGCGALPAQAQPALPFVFVTAAPNASPTPTPFQPIPWTPTGTFLPSPTIGPATETPTPPAPTQTEFPTVDPNMLMNTIEPLSTIEAAFAQLRNVPASRTLLASLSEIAPGESKLDTSPL